MGVVLGDAAVLSWRLADLTPHVRAPEVVVAAVAGGGCVLEFRSETTKRGEKGRREERGSISL
jgi:hypothetical protein